MNKMLKRNTRAKRVYSRAVAAAARAPASGRSAPVAAVQVDELATLRFLDALVFTPGAKTAPDSFPTQCWEAFAARVGVLDASARGLDRHEVAEAQHMLQWSEARSASGQVIDDADFIASGGLVRGEGDGAEGDGEDDGDTDDEGDDEGEAEAPAAPAPAPTPVGEATAVAA